MNVQTTIFICYANADDTPDASGEGWVQRFARLFRLLLEQMSGISPEMRLVSEVEPLEGLGADDAIVCVFSPAFAEAVRKGGWNGLFDSGTLPASVLLKAFVAPVSYNRQPKVLQPLLGSDFYRLDRDSGDPVALDGAFDSAGDKTYWMHLVDMAYDLQQSVSQLHTDIPAATGASGEAQAALRTVYLAETGLDLKEQRDTIKRELIRHGYRVLPDAALPAETAPLREAVERDLRQCRLSVFLVGEDYGAPIEGHDDSVPRLQHRIAAEHEEGLDTGPKDRHVSPISRQHDRLIWLKPNFVPSDPRQAFFVENLRRESRTLQGADLLQSRIEEFKSAIINRLQSLRYQQDRQEEIQAELSGRRSEKTAYLIADERDQEASSPLRRWLEEKGWQVLHMDKVPNSRSPRQAHREFMARSSVVLIFLQNATSLWLDSKLADLMKAPGWGRNARRSVNLLFLGDSASVDLSSLPLDNPFLVDLRILNRAELTEQQAYSELESALAETSEQPVAE